MTTNISFTVDRQSLTQGLLSLQKLGSGQKNATTHLFVKQNTLSLYLQTDTRTLLSEIPTGQLIGEGSLLTDTKKLTEFIQTIHGKEISVTVSDSSLRVVCGAARGSLPLSHDETQLPQKNKGGTTTPFSVLGDALSLLLFSCSTETSRPTLSSLCVIPTPEAGARLVATDGFRLSLVQITSSIGVSKKILVPATFL